MMDNFVWEECETIKKWALQLLYGYWVFSINQTKNEISLAYLQMCTLSGKDILSVI